MGKTKCDKAFVPTLHTYNKYRLWQINPRGGVVL